MFETFQSGNFQEGNALKDWRRIIIKELLTRARDLTSDKNGNYCLHANDDHIFWSCKLAYEISISMK